MKEDRDPLFLIHIPLILEALKYYKLLTKAGKDVIESARFPFVLDEKLLS